MKKIKPIKIGRKMFFSERLLLLLKYPQIIIIHCLGQKKLILSAKNSGADAVKIQSYTPESLTLNCKKKDFVIKNLPKILHGKNIKLITIYIGKLLLLFHGTKNFLSLQEK